MRPRFAGLIMGPLKLRLHSSFRVAGKRCGRHQHFCAGFSEKVRQWRSGLTCQTAFSVIERSEADEESRLCPRISLDCFASLVMTNERAFEFPRHESVRVMHRSRPFRRRGRRECRCSGTDEHRLCRRWIEPEAPGPAPWRTRSRSRGR